MGKNESPVLTREMLVAALKVGKEKSDGDIVVYLHPDQVGDFERRFRKHLGHSMKDKRK